MRNSKVQRRNYELASVCISTNVRSINWEFCRFKLIFLLIEWRVPEYFQKYEWNSNQPSQHELFQIRYFYRYSETNYFLSLLSPSVSLNLLVVHSLSLSREICTEFKDSCCRYCICAWWIHNICKNVDFFFQQVHTCTRARILWNGERKKKRTKSELAPFIGKKNFLSGIRLRQNMRSDVTWIWIWMFIHSILSDIKAISVDEIYWLRCCCRCNCWLSLIFCD